VRLVVEKRASEHELELTPRPRPDKRWVQTQTRCPGSPPFDDQDISGLMPRLRSEWPSYKGELGARVRGQTPACSFEWQ